MKLPDLNRNKSKGLKLLDLELNIKRNPQKNNENSSKIKEINKIYKAMIPNIPNIDELKEKYKIPYKSPLKTEKKKKLAN